MKLKKVSGTPDCCCNIGLLFLILPEIPSLVGDQSTDLLYCHRDHVNVVGGRQYGWCMVYSTQYVSPITKHGQRALFPAQHPLRLSHNVPHNLNPAQISSTQTTHFAGEISTNKLCWSERRWEMCVGRAWSLLLMLRTCPLPQLM